MLIRAKHRSGIMAAHCAAILYGCVPWRHAPSIHVLIRRYAPNGMESRTFSYSNCALFLGGMVGSMGMGVVASYFGLPMIFIFSAVLLLINQTVARKIVADAAVLKE